MCALPWNVHARNVKGLCVNVSAVQRGREGLPECRRRDIRRGQRGLVQVLSEVPQNVRQQRTILKRGDLKQNGMPALAILSGTSCSERRANQQIPVRQSR